MVHLSSTNVFELVCSLFVGVIITLALSLYYLHKRLQKKETFVRRLLEIITDMIGWDPDITLDYTTLMEVTDEIKETLADYTRLEDAVDRVLTTFESDEAKGYRSRDRQFAITVLKEARKSTAETPVPQDYEIVVTSNGAYVVPANITVEPDGTSTAPGADRMEIAALMSKL
jgi:hypothetical protein